jgi:hypothetical protein
MKSFISTKKFIGGFVVTLIITASFAAFSSAYHNKIVDFEVAAIPVSAESKKQFEIDSYYKAKVKAPLDENTPTF